jgi:hypothetical protein
MFIRVIKDIGLIKVINVIRDITVVSVIRVLRIVSFYKGNEAR